jgi:hypothetical protein
MLLLTIVSFVHLTFNSYHDHEHWPGMALMCVRLMLAAVFCVGCSQTMKVQQHNGRVVSFLAKMRFLGASWFAAFPLLVFMQMFFKPTRRHFVVTGGALCLQSAALIFMALTFLLRSEFFHISSLSKMAPGRASMNNHLQGARDAITGAVARVKPSKVAMD